MLSCVCEKFTSVSLNVTQFITIALERVNQNPNTMSSQPSLRPNLNAQSCYTSAFDFFGGGVWGVPMTSSNRVVRVDLVGPFDEQPNSRPC